MAKKANGSRLTTETYSFYKASEGGPGRAHVLRLLREQGIKADGVPSIYVGHDAVRVTGGPKVQRQAESIIFPGGV